MHSSRTPALPFGSSWKSPLFTLTAVLSFAIALSFAAAVLSGLAPALQASGASLLPALKAVGADGMESAPSKLRLRNVFVVGQITMSLLLVIAAGLFLRALQHAASVQPGLDQERVDVVTLDLSIAGYRDEAGRVFVRQLLDHISAMPGIESATASVDCRSTVGAWAWARREFQDGRRASAVPTASAQTGMSSSRGSSAQCGCGW